MVGDTAACWDEPDRVAALGSYRVLDTPPEPVFDEVVRLAARACRTPMALVSLVDDHRQWFKAEVGLGITETPLDMSICAHAIREPGLFVVADATKDARFSDNPLVTEAPHLRFYAGAVLETPNGWPLGTLCVLDRVPRTLDEDQMFTLKTLARQVMSHLESRRAVAERDDALATSKTAEERQTLLVRELHHRVRNTLAMVQALLGSSARSSRDIEEFHETFSARIASLAKTQTLLTEDYWQTASLREMLRQELEPFHDGRDHRFVLEGPAAELSADLAVPVGMALHELTTNSAKHGSLSVPEGQLLVKWDLRTTSGRRKLYLEWIERNGPPVREPQRKGFGTTMLQRVLPAQSDADVRVEFRREGLRFEMEAPLIERRLVPQY